MCNPALLIPIDSFKEQKAKEEEKEEKEENKSQPEKAEYVLFTYFPLCTESLSLVFCPLGIKRRMLCYSVESASSAQRVLLWVQDRCPCPLGLLVHPSPGW